MSASASACPCATSDVGDEAGRRGRASAGGDRRTGPAPMTAEATGPQGPGLIVVVPTRNRPEPLLRLLGDLENQLSPPERVLIVDASDPGHAQALEELLPARCRLIPHWPPSAAAQRNRGIAAAIDDAAMVALFDDDMRLPADALSRMQAFWASASAQDVVAAGFNMLGEGRRRRKRFAGGALLERLGLYPSRPGAVAASGWHSPIGEVATDTDVHWLPTAAMVWRSDALQRLGGFDEHFDGYSYLEDLEMALRARTLGRLIVVANARCRHAACTTSKISSLRFGQVEVRNRLYLVGKHQLSMPRCYVNLLGRAALTLAQAVMRLRRASLCRFAGNLLALARPERPRRDLDSRVAT